MIKQQKIRVKGVVQGVGFRPFVYQIAIKNKLVGHVLNDSDGVLIEIQGDEHSLSHFILQLRNDAPPLSNIHDIQITDVTPDNDGNQFNDFRIIASHHLGVASTLVPVDSHVCDDCLAEMHDPTDRRYHYPFINCTNCGPRFSIIKQLPYDRIATTMSAFTLCEACQEEYTNPLSRRYHAQPIACPECGPTLTYVDTDGEYTDKALQQAKIALQSGKIIAIKSLGGFHLAVNAYDDKAVQRLRHYKQRKTKPFAVMVKNLETARQLAHISSLESDYLTSSGRPIVLLKKRQDTELSPISQSVAPDNPWLGIMLCSAPLHDLLFDETLTALIMTSGNISGYPIEFTNEGASKRLSVISDGILYNNREIFMRVDDSVMRVSEHHQLDKPIITWFRKGRGYAPYPVKLPFTSPKNIIAIGSELKNTIGFLRDDTAYISQHIGDVKNPEIIASQHHSIAHLTKLYNVQADSCTTDAHPNFANTLPNDLASLPIQPVQHHHAHMAACMAENGITDKAIGVIFDGIGYGSDNTLWGGEFLFGDYQAVERVAHLRQLPLIGGDKAVREPLRIAWVLLAESDLLTDVPLLDIFKNNKPNDLQIFSKMREKSLNTFQTSSIGRLFDGVSALLGQCSFAEYEAQAPIALEGLLDGDLSMSETHYYFDIITDTDSTLLVDYRPVIQTIVTDIHQEVSKKIISQRFHSSIVNMIVTVCQQLQSQFGNRPVVLSGGVFLNEFILVNTLIALRQQGIQVFSHRDVPTGDGGIALGQLAITSSIMKEFDS